MYLHSLLLLGWFILGLSLRLINLGAKNASSIEISTLGFSLGHGFNNIPLNQVITWHQLVSPLRFNLDTNPQDVIEHLLTETNHPPLYFLLTHFWLNLWAVQDDLVSLFLVRSLSVIFGSLGILAIFGLAWLAFRSLIIAQLAAGFMSVSPYGIYLAQEARHYTLTILWIMASLACLLIAIQYIIKSNYLPISLVCLWITINTLGMATHYFFAITLGIEGLIIGVFWFKDWQLKKQNIFFNPYWWRIYAVGLGSFIGSVIWLIPLHNLSNNHELTDWIETGLEIDEFWQPIIRLLAWWITMIFLLPVEGTNLIFTIISALILFLVLWQLLPVIVTGIRTTLNNPNSRLSLQFLGGYFLIAIALFLVFIYIMLRDLSLASRYQFVYFPVVIVLLATSLAIAWQNNVILSGLFKRLNGQKFVLVILLMGLLGAITVVSNYGYQKSQRADLLANYIDNHSTPPVLTAITYKSHAELRALIALGLEFKNHESEFLLVDNQDYIGEGTAATLINIVNQYPRPFDLWGINLKANSNDLAQLNCVKNEANHPKINGYRYKLYHCQ